MHSKERIVQNCELLENEMVAMVSIVIFEILLLFGAKECLPLLR